MKIIHDIKLHPDSYLTIDRSLSQYSISFETPNDLWIDRLIVHIYPTHDTRNEYGELQGYGDSLFFDIDIYDAKNLIKYPITNKDAININSANPHNVQIFKDGSTMVTFIGRHLIDCSCQCMYVYSEDHVNKII